MNGREQSGSRRRGRALPSDSSKPKNRSVEKMLAVVLVVFFLLAFACKPKPQSDSTSTSQDETSKPLATNGHANENGQSHEVENKTSEVEDFFADQLQRVADGTSDSIMILDRKLGDAQFQRLASLDQQALERIRELVLDHGSLSGQSVPLIASLPNIQHLRLRKTAIDDESARLLANAHSLRMLNLPQSELTDAGLRHLSDLPNLELLRISSDELTDAGVRELGDHPTLLFVHLINVEFGKEGLLALATIPNLQSLYIDGTEFSDETWREFFASRNDVHVHLDQFHHDLDPGRHDHEGN